MLHAKVQDHRTISSVDEDFRKFLPYMGMAAILVMTWTIYINLVSRVPRRLHTKFGVNWPSGFKDV